MPETSERSDRDLKDNRCHHPLCRAQGAELPASAALQWPPIARFIAAERHLAERMLHRPVLAALYEFLRFGVKQAWACLFAALMLTLLIITRYVYPDGMPLYRYDFLFLSAIAVQAFLLTFKLETFDEARIILLYHLIGTVMEIFKTRMGSWIYPEPSFFHIGGVPLFTGFMYSCVGSYLCRVWRLFDFRFVHHPPLWSLLVLSVLIYLNFFAHHYMPDMRLGLFVLTALLFLRSQVYFKVWRVHRSMPLLLGFVLVAMFIWFSENIGTFTRTWVYPSQLHEWAPVSFAKLGSWFLLMIISYSLVALINRPRPIAAPEPDRALGIEPLRRSQGVIP